MTLTIYQHNLLENGTLYDVINVVNACNVIREGVRVHMGDGYHRNGVFVALLQDFDAQFEWTRANREVFVTMRPDIIPRPLVELMKNSKMLITGSSKALPCVNYLDVLSAVIEYDKTFDECYPVPLREARLYDVLRNM